MASGSLTFPNAGSYSVTATYSGDSDHAGSASLALTEIVNCVGCVGTTTTIQSPVTVVPSLKGEPANTVELRQTTTLDVTVTATSGVTAPTGTVQLQENGVILGQATLTAGGGTSSTAMITVNHLNVRSHNVVVIYTGASGFDPSASANLQLRFSPMPH
jgi:large repetitive protein